MSKVLNFSNFIAIKAKEEEAFEFNSDLNSMIKRTHRTMAKVQPFQAEMEELVAVLDENQFQRLMEAELSRMLLEGKKVSSDLFLCGIYVAKMIAANLNNPPASWYAFDYQQSTDGSLLRQGGDVCLLIRSLFPEWAQRRLIDLDYYEYAGSGLYYQFYGKTGKEIGYYMSQNFSTMAALTQRMVRDFVYQGV